MAKDTCILCSVETAYDYETHIDVRVGYIEGAGQLCSACWDKSNDRSMLAVPEHIIRNTPNDMELGGKIRALYFESKK